MKTYLRFTRAEYQALALACGSLELTDRSFRRLKPFLVASLRDTMPALAQRLALFRSYQIGIIYQYFKDQKRATEGRRTPLRRFLSAEEFRAIAEACRGLPLRGRFLSYSRCRLILHFREAAPPLAAKLGSLSERQFERLCQRVSVRNNRSA